jgi:hypothetical protein
MILAGTLLLPDPTGYRSARLSGGWLRADDGRIAEVQHPA